MRRILAACSILAVLGFAACNLGDDCDRSGCEAMDAPAPSGDIETGIAGAVSSASDVVDNGCAECTLSSGTLYIWGTIGSLDSKDEVVGLINADNPIFEIEAEEYYQQELPDISYVACVINWPEAQCATFDLAEGDVATVHMAFSFGSSEVVLFLPGSNSPNTDNVYTLSGADEVPDVGN